MASVFTIVGARPQFIKAAPVSRALAGSGLKEILVHTGQHFDALMSDVFFDELDIPKPAHNLEVNSLGHGAMTGRMLEKLEAAMIAEAPDIVLIYGDTNSTLAGALAAAKIGIPVAHVEAGLRSFNRRMPEEINRVVADHVSTLLLCPTEVAVTNLGREGIAAGVRMVGDVMYDAFEQNLDRAHKTGTILSDLGIEAGAYHLLTVHRAENVDQPERLGEILRGVAASGKPTIFPVHPRTRAAMQSAGVAPGANTRLIDPVGYLEMLILEESAEVVVTDSGGVQKEAYFAGRPCVTLRLSTEWTETVAAGWNVLVGTDAAAIAEAMAGFRPAADRPPLFGDGHAAQKVVAAIAEPQPIR
jgi:UDP-GlcNAc3NAcA epimerase